MDMITTQIPEDYPLLVGLQQSDSSSIKAIYDLALPSVIHWVKENKGTEADARDIFQEALIALYRRLEEGEFKLTCSLKSYIRIVCRNLWLSRLRKQSKVSLSGDDDLEKVDLDNGILERIEKSEKEQLFFKHFDALGEKCQQILQWFFDKIPLAEIAKRLDSSENYIKKRKFQCKEKLIKAIQSDVLFKEFENHNK